MKKSDVTSMTRADFERIVFDGLLSDDEATVLRLYIQNVSVSETAERMNVSNRTVEKLRQKVRRKIEKLR